MANTEQRLEVLERIYTEQVVEIAKLIRERDAVRRELDRVTRWHRDPAFWVYLIGLAAVLLIEAIR